jgi:adenylate kinase
MPEKGLKITDDFIAEGWLKKESHGFMGIFQDRYFVLDVKARVVRYYDGEDKRNLKGEYMFTNQSSVQMARVTGNGTSADHMFFLSGSYAKNQNDQIVNLYMTAASDFIRDQWIDAFHRGIQGRGLSHFEVMKENISDFIHQEEQECCLFLNWLGFSFRRCITGIVPFCRNEFEDAKEAMRYEKAECIKDLNYCCSCTGSMVCGAVTCALCCGGYTGPPKKIIIAGAPASGKGTQCERIRDYYGCVHLSTGDMLRAAVEAGTEVGKQAKVVMDSGGLVADDIIIKIILERLRSQDCVTRGWLLDGFPRTGAQASALAKAGIVCDNFILLDVPDDVLVTRVTGRRLDPVTGDIYHMKFKPPPPTIEKRLTQRSDDTAEKLKPRLVNYHKNLAAITGFYMNKTLKVDGNRDPNEVWESIKLGLNDELS